MTDSASGTDPTGPTGPQGTSELSSGGGMSTGAKVLFACLGVTVLGIVAAAVAVGVLGFGIWRSTDSIRTTVGEQQQAGDMLQEIENEHPFEAPEDGVVDEEGLNRFLAVTEDAWQEIQPWAEDLRELRETAAGERGALEGLRALASGARAVGGLARSRVALAEALDAHETSLAEYIWTGIQLDRAVDAVEGDRSTEGVPPANLELVEGRAAEIPRLDGSMEGEGVEAVGDDSGAVLAVAVLWGMTDLSTWQAMGLDTLTER